jgi:DNA-binding transcriptional regulator LsrR (DeoR family)
MRERMSSTFVHDPAALVTAAELYYRDQLSQQEVAQRLGVSRSTVSRMLQLARDEGIVHIEIRQPASEPATARSPEQLADALRTALGLRRVVVVPPARRGGVQPLVAPALGEIAALGLRAGDALAVSWGRTVLELARARRWPSLPGVLMVPAIAGFEERDERFQANDIARRAADASGADVSMIHAPALPSARLRRSLLADEDISRRLAVWDRLSAALVGIGPPLAEADTGPAHVMAAAGELRGAVGDVVSRYFDTEGRPVPFAGEQRLLGVSREQLRNAGTVIAVAAGAAKGASIAGAARAGLIDVLVTDETTAGAALAAAAAEPAP